MDKYLIDNYSDKPEKVKVLKQTEKTATIERTYHGGKTYERKIVNPDIFDTFEEAKAVLISRQESRLESLRLQLQRENGKLGQLKGLKE